MNVDYICPNCLYCSDSAMLVLSHWLAQHPKERTPEIEQLYAENVARTRAAALALEALGEDSHV